MKTVTFGIFGAVLGLVMASAPAEAQLRGEVVVRVGGGAPPGEYAGAYGGVRYVDPYRGHRVRKHRKGRGPAFCRSGRGHPVHGWGWCVEKGWAPAPYRYERAAVPWMPVRWDHVYLYEPDDRYRRGHPVLIDIVGERVYRRLHRHRDRLGLRAGLTFAWFDRGDGAVVLQVRAGSYPIAEFLDYGYDGYVDRVMLRRG